jgi:hypothetical protein
MNREHSSDGSGEGSSDRRKPTTPVQHDEIVSPVEGQTYAYSEDRKIGITGAVFLILNKMIGTGSKRSPGTRTAMSRPLY